MEGLITDIGPLYTEQISLPTAPFKLAAVDTETCRIRESRHDSRRKTRHEPPDTPELVLGSICKDGSAEVFHRAELTAAIQDLLSEGYHLVFHNVAFDYHVLRRFSPDLGRKLARHVEENKVHDTQILEQLIQIARGDQTVDKKVIRAHKLKDLARRRCGMHLAKDSGVFLNFDAFLDPRSTVPRNFLEYAAADAVATYKVFCSQWKEASLYAEPTCRYPVFSNCRDRFGLLTESIQVKGALALSWLERFPLRVDLPEVERLRSRLHREAQQLEDALIAFGFAKRTPKTERFGLSHTTLRRLLGEYARERGLEPPYSSGSSGRAPVLSLTYDYWAEVLPRLGSGGLLDKSASGSLEGRLSVWLRYCRVRKLLSTYLEPYGTSSTHFTSYYNLGARTGRVSSVRPNIQQIPKRRDGIRKCFIPQPGYRLIEGDYKAAELVALAQIYKMMFGESTLGSEINAGTDPHEATGRRIVGARIYETNPKKYRQAAKAVNFGLPGGLGWRKFRTYAKKSYGVDFSEDEAREIRALALEADPALKAFLFDSYSPKEALQLAADNLGLPFGQLITALRAWRLEDENEVHWHLALRRLRAWSRGDPRFEIPVPPGFAKDWDLFRSTTVTPTGRVRGRASYTEAHNTPFQGLVADGAKLAAWNLYQAWCEDPYWNPVAFVHDSFVIECRPEQAMAAGSLLAGCMVQGLKQVCPGIRVEVDLTEPRERWGENTTSYGTVITEEAPEVHASEATNPGTDAGI